MSEFYNFDDLLKIFKLIELLQGEVSVTSPAKSSRKWSSSAHSQAPWEIPNLPRNKHGSDFGRSWEAWWDTLYNRVE